MRTDPKFILRNHAYKGCSTWNFVSSGLASGRLWGVLLDWGLNKFLLKLSGFCQHSEPLAKTAHLIPHTVILRRQCYFSLEEEKDGGTPEWLPKFGNHRDSTLALVPPNCSISPRNVANFPSQTGMLASLPCFVWVTEELLQPAKERLQSQVWVGGKRLGPRGLCLRNHRSYGYKENLFRDWGMGAGGGRLTKRMGRVILFSSTFTQTLRQTSLNILSNSPPQRENEVPVLPPELLHPGQPRPRETVSKATAEMG